MDSLFSDKNKKIIIGSSLKEADIVIKDYVSKNKEPISDFEKYTILDLCKEILIKTLDKDSFIIDDTEAIGVLYCFLHDKIKDKFIYSVIPEESFSLKTVENIYQTINIVRTGKLNEENNKINKNLLTLINDFEKYLEDRKYYDSPLIFKNTLDLLEKKKASELLSWGSTVSIYKLPSLENRLTYIETAILDKLTESYGTIHKIKYKSIKPTFKKVKAYGYSNEIRYLVDQIRKVNNLSDVGIYLTSDKYNNAIKAYFDNNGIDCLFESGETIRTKDIVGLINSIVEFISNHYSISALSKIYKNPSINFYNKENKFSFESGLKDLKADKEYILKAINNTKKDATKVYSPERRQFLSDLINLFDKDDPIGVMYSKILNFIFENHNGYTYTNKFYWKDIKQPLYDLKRFFSICSEISFKYEEKIDLIKNSINKIKFSNEPSEKNSFVSVYTLPYPFIHHKDCFFLDLSANELEENEMESPLISDEILSNSLCSKYYVKLAKNKNTEKFDAIYKMISTANKNNTNIHLIYSDYDSVEFKKLAPSSFYNNFKFDSEDEISFNGVDEININASVATNNKKRIFPNNEKIKSQLNKLSFAPTALETLMICPLRYIYSHIYSNIELDEFDNQWLKGGNFGEFAHRILQYYFKPSGSKRIFEKKDSIRFEKSFLKSFNELKQIWPFSNKEIQIKEANDVKEMVSNYLDRYYANIDPLSPYKTIYCEFEFKENDGFVFNRNYKFYGTIDRVDGFIDKSGNLNIRIIDYKTTGSSFDKKKENFILPQAFVYVYLIKKYCKKHKSEIEKILGQKYKKFNEKNIVFIYEMLQLNKYYCYDDSERKPIEDAVIKALKNYKKILKEGYYGQIYESFIKNEICEESEYNKGRCSYCSFAKYCQLKQEMGDKTIWQW